MAKSKKGKRKLLIDDKLYYWSVKMDIDTYPTYLNLTVILDDKVFLRRGYPAELEPLVITPGKVRQEILTAYDEQKKCAILAQLSDQAPEGWHHLRSIEDASLLGIGLDPDQDLLLIADYCEDAPYHTNFFNARLIGLESGETIAEETVGRECILPKNITCKAIGPLAGKTIPFASWGGSSLPLKNQAGDQLYRPSFSKQALYFQPRGENCLDLKNNQGCVQLYHERYLGEQFGFSASGHYMVIVQKDKIAIWSDL